MILPFISAACLLLNSGCIENPGPDKELKHGNNHSSVTAPYPSGYLEFTLRLEMDRTYLEIRNVGKSLLDSVDFLLQITPGYNDYWFSMGFRQGTDAPLYRRIRGLRSGESRIFENVDLGSFLRISDFQLAAQILVSYQDGKRYGNPLSGYYSGTYRTQDSLEGIESGETHGFFNAEGQFVIWFSPLPKSFLQNYPDPPPYVFEKAIVGETTSKAYLRDLEYMKHDSVVYLAETEFTLVEGILTASFRAKDPAKTADSLGITLKAEVLE